MAISTYISMITLNVNGQYAAIKRHIVAEWIQNKTHIYAAYKRLTSDLKPHRLKVRGWKMVSHADENQKKVSSNTYTT